MRSCTGKPSEAVHASFSGYVAREMGRAEALLKVVGSRPENLVDNLFTLMPSGSPADFQRILELKAGRRQSSQTRTTLCIVPGWGGSSSHVEWMALPCRCRTCACACSYYVMLIKPQASRESVSCFWTLSVTSLQVCR